ncbi:MAG: TatD family hydrolase [Steroidobacteraceae bacterium]
MSGARLAPLIDIGINLGHDSYDHDRDAVIARARELGVAQFVITGASIEGTRAAIDLARADPGRSFATAGCHPHHAIDYKSMAAELAALAAAPEVVAVGECGLDYHRNFSSPAEQRMAFARQLEVAVALGKPLFLHERDAHADLVALLSEHGTALPPAVVHCFTGDAAALDRYLEMGLWIGITGWICDERRGLHLRDLVARIPAGKLMIETDGPYLLPRDLDPKPDSRRNEPMYLPHVARAVAAARGETPQVLAAHTTATARAFFALPNVD